MSVAEPSVYVCSIASCRKTFKTVTYLKRHLSTYHRDAPDLGQNFVCDVDDCKAVFKLSKQLYDHKYNAHKTGKVYSCDVCTFSSPTPSKLARHRKTHDGYPCRVTGCAYLAKTVSERRKHASSVHRVKRFHCLNCSKRFDRAEKLATHELLHKSDAKCPEAGCNFVCQPRHLAKHVKECHSEKIPTHGGRLKTENPYECHLCRKTFAKNIYLKKHVIQVHLGAAKEQARKCSFVCPLADCQRRFINHAKWESHVNSSHTDRKPYKCSMNGCLSSFAGKMSLQRHMRVFHLTILAIDDDGTLVKELVTNQVDEFLSDGESSKESSNPTNCL